MKSIVDEWTQCEKNVMQTFWGTQYNVWEEEINLSVSTFNFSLFAISNFKDCIIT